MHIYLRFGCFKILLLTRAQIDSSVMHETRGGTLMARRSTNTLESSYFGRLSAIKVQLELELIPDVLVPESIPFYYGFHCCGLCTVKRPSTMYCILKFQKTVAAQYHPHSLVKI